MSVPPFLPLFLPRFLACGCLAALLAMALPAGARVAEDGAGQAGAATRSAAGGHAAKPGKARAKGDKARSGKTKGAGAGAGAAAGVAAAAGTAAVAAGNCREIRVDLRDQGLREALQQLAPALRFELDYRASENPRVSATGSYAGVDLVRLLTRDANAALHYRSDPRCPDGMRLSRVQVLAAGMAQVPAPAPAPPRPTAPDPAATAGRDAFLRAHGLAP